MPQHEKIDYVEFATPDLSKTKAFFTNAFGWTFQDFGDGYTAFDGTAGLTGGFYQAEQVSKWANGGALIVLFSDNIEATQSKIEQAGGKIVKPIFGPCLNPVNFVHDHFFLFLELVTSSPCQLCLPVRISHLNNQFHS